MIVAAIWSEAEIRQQAMNSLGEVAEQLSNEEKKAAAMQSEPGLRLFRSNNLTETDYETFYVLDGDRVLRKSKAILHLNRYLAWPWRGGLILALIPRKVRDSLYDLMARNRRKLMGVRHSCRVPTSDERERFLT